MEEDRVLRIGVVMAGHVIWLSTAALRIIRGHREHWITTEAGPIVQYYPTLVWLPLLVAFFIGPWKVPLPDPMSQIGFAVAWVSAIFGGVAMWTLGRGYGIRLDLFKGHTLKTDGVFAVCRHPLYLGVIGYHVGAALVLESAFLLAVTLLVILPYTAIRLTAEDRVLEAGFENRFTDYAARTPALLPFPR